MKIKLSNGICAGRFSCRNVDKKCCNPVPVGKSNYVERRHYVDRGRTKCIY